MIEVNEQCKKCFHFQVCANVLKQQLFIREKMLQEENPKCEHFIPTADVVEVVRCGQCQHWKINPHNLYGGYCPYSERASLDHFCSYGKRKEVKDA